MSRASSWSIMAGQSASPSTTIAGQIVQPEARRLTFSRIRGPIDVPIA